MNFNTNSVPNANEDAAPRTDPERDKAEHFLTLLDEDAEAFTFQTFDDRKGRKDGSLARVLNGSLDEHWNTLVDLNHRGAGIFVTVNETDLAGRKKENIVRIWAVWQEADRGDEPQLPVDPHIIVESSPGQHHRYVLVDGATLDEFDAVQQRLVDDFGSDRNANRMTTRFSTRGDIMTKYEPEKLPYVKKANGAPIIERRPLVPAWMGSRIRKTYDQMVFEPTPGLVAGSTALPDGKVLNLYQGLAIEPNLGACQLMLDHIKDVWCNADPVAYEYVIQWLARMLQRPNERGHTVIVLRSGEGTGKNIIIDVLVRAFGEHATVAVKPDDLTGRFNDHLGTSVLVFANEAVWGGDKTQEGALKSLITDEELPVERKYIPKYRVRNCTHLIMASNNDWVAPVGLDDRRFVILDVSESRKGDAEYFSRLAGHIANGGEAAFLDHLLTRDISDFNPRVLPDLGINQATKRDAKIRGADSVTQWWLHCLDTGEILLTGALDAEAGTFAAALPKPDGPVNLAGDWSIGRVEAPKQGLYDAYTEWTRRSHKHVEHLVSFGRKLAQLSDVKTSRPRASVEPQRPRVFVLPTLDECRNQFEAFTRQVWDWDKDDDPTGVAGDTAEPSEVLPRRPSAREIMAEAQRAAEEELVARAAQS